MPSPNCYHQMRCDVDGTVLQPMYPSAVALYSLLGDKQRVERCDAPDPGAAPLSGRLDIESGASQHFVIRDIQELHSSFSPPLDSRPFCSARAFSLAALPACWPLSGQLSSACFREVVFPFLFTPSVQFFRLVILVFPPPAFSGRNGGPAS
ncbi:hypothetical protein MA16_Dca001677 [Dendrobium catenatum]|uniref:Uncharacterized protein n=1 Tax=Dendrobium catenatum TaxID=906689 RepID=A0A2I0WN49_9ASPA|nr:hypothetical protein MA16_Dca001677 [Dendrobium catenatum]